MAMSVSSAEKWAKGENENKRQISTVKYGRSVEDYLWEQVRSSENLLIHGESFKRECVMYHWLRQLFTDEEIFDRPVIVIGNDTALANEMYMELTEHQISPVRDFVQVDVDHACYEPFLGMTYEQVIHVIQGIAQRRLTPISDWNILHGVCDMLISRGYELSLYNLYRIYQLGIDKVVDLLEHANFYYAAQEARRNVDEFQKLSGILQLFQSSFRMISEKDGQGYSILDMVISESQKKGSMPFFYFILRDNMREDFLEYLAEELRAVSAYRKPILVIDSVRIQGGIEKASDFYQYLKTASDLSLTLTAQDCAAMIQEQDIQEFLGRYSFLMFLMESTDSVEKLTKETLGSFEHITIEKNAGSYREFFHVFPSGSNSGWGSKKEMWLRIRGVDVRELTANECYICRKTEASKYTKMKFQR